MIIAVDGPTASGKGTIARALAAHFSLPHLDTGLLYRATGRQVVLNGGNPDNARDAAAAADFPENLLDDPILRSEGSGGLASRVSVHPALRAALLERQRAFAAQPGGAVLDGRDIGTVIAPDAAIKLYVIASIEARAKRRFLEMCERGENPVLAAIADDLQRRDERDTTRKLSPLVAASDAILFDTSSLTRDEAVTAAIALAEQHLSAQPK